MRAKYRMLAVAATMGLGAVQPALASTIEITLPGETEVGDIDATYDCGDFTLEAHYINSGDVSLATLAWQEQFAVASEVISGSGARYAAGPYIWWVKGDTATLYDSFKGPDDPGIACKTSTP